MAGGVYECIYYCDYMFAYVTLCIYEDIFYLFSFYLSYGTSSSDMYALGIIIYKLISGKWANDDFCYRIYFFVYKELFL
jgi:serine/threonine protein kinase